MERATSVLVLYGGWIALLQACSRAQPILGSGGLDPSGHSYIFLY